MTRSTIAVLLVSAWAAAGCDSGSAGAVCEKMIDCAGGGDKSYCVDYLNDMRSDMRGEAWDAFTDCLLGLPCEDLLGPGMARCLIDAADAVPEGVADGLIEEWCGKMIDCGFLAISVGDCVEQQRSIEGSNADIIGIYSDSVLACMETCTAGLECHDVNMMWQICMEECGIIPEQEPYCENGYEQDGECICDTGWAGTWCDECAPGYVMDRWGDCGPGCQTDSCSGHGTCDDTTGEIVCTCDTGWDGERCDECASGYVMDPFGDCVPGCQPDSCSGHGTCDDWSGEITCTCEPGYTGNACQDCAPGYVQVDDVCYPTGSCEVDGIPCDDGHWCTDEDVCSGGVCMGSARSCDDGVVCTEDSCDESGDTCVHEGTPTPGLEGYLGDPTCSNGLDDDCDGFTDAGDDDCWLDPCVTAADCLDDGNDCTQARCDAGYCDHQLLADGSACSGDDPCTTTFLCRDAVCIPGPADLDADGDGAVDAACPGGLDCDDTDPGIGPGAEGPRGDMTCTDGVDNDCDGLTDSFEPACWDTICTPEGWCWESPLPQGHYLEGLWAAAADDAWAVGEDGLILHWNGTGWSQEPGPVAGDLAAVHGCSASEVWAVGRFGDVLRYNGVAWIEVPTGVTIDFLDVMCVAGTDPVEVWITGNRGQVMHWDGAAFTEYDLGTGWYIYSVWAFAADDVWVVGRDGVLQHFDGTNWTPFDSGTMQDLIALWGVSDALGDQLWAGGDGGVVLHWDGATWSPEATGVNEEITGMWGTAPDDLWAVASWWGAILHRTQAGWSVVAADPEVPFLYDVWGSGTDDVWAVGQGGGLFHFDGAAWTSPAPTTEPLYAVCAMDLAGGAVDAWAAGDVVMRFDGAQWRRQATPSFRVEDLWCRDPADIWAVGEHNLLHWDGMSWVEHPDISTLELHAVSGLPGGGAAWAVGQSGTVLRWDGLAWTPEDAGVIANLQDVWATGDGADAQAWVVGDQGTVLFWDDRGWAQMDSGTTEQLWGVWGDGNGKVWAAGTNGTVIAWTGSGWTTLTDPALSRDFTDVWGTSEDDVWLAGWWYVVHWDGTTWTEEQLPNHSFGSITATLSGHVWAAGGWGGILHKWP